MSLRTTIFEDKVKLANSIYENKWTKFWALPGTPGHMTFTLLAA
jgi:hypothetical protein